MRIQQAAAIPYRRRKGKIEICLITSRRSKAWTFPKGMIDDGYTSAKTALNEAEEEAGLKGKVEGRPIGIYHYEKWSRSLAVEVHLMRVTKAADEWDEADWRKRRWFKPDDAREVLPHDALRTLLDRALARIALTEDEAE
jgi:8-oxo-dGTP pyrophosphatase MutT (NUDIX family)